MRSVVAKGLGEENKCKRAWGTFWSDGNVCAAGYTMLTLVKSHQITHLKLVNLIVCQLYLKNWQKIYSCKKFEKFSKCPTGILSKRIMMTLSLRTEWSNGVYPSTVFFSFHMSHIRRRKEKLRQKYALLITKNKQLLRKYQKHLEKCDQTGWGGGVP